MRSGFLLVRLKKFVRAFVPVGLLELRARLRRRDQLWRGVFASLDDVRSSGRGYESDAWFHRTLPWTRSLLEAHERRGPIPSDTETTREHRTFLAIAALVASLRGSVTVVDFGGGLGAAYIYLVDSLPASAIVRYHVVDLPRTCEEGRALFHAYRNIEFHTEIPSGSIPDIIYASGALQFARDYQKTLEELAHLGAAFVVCTELPADHIPTFATLQVNVDDGAPVWFFNLDEIVGLMAAHGYSLLLDSKVALGHDQSNLPATYRSSNYHTLLFCDRKRAPYLKGIAA
jgi:putative methyltransferase (TIGR04325 family)